MTPEERKVGTTAAPSRRRRRSTRVPPERIPWLRYDRFSRSVTEHLRVRPVPGYPFWVLTVRNPVHHTQYQVTLAEYPQEESQFCSCVDFARKAIGTCKHIEAARAWLGGQPELRLAAVPPRGAPALWKAIDRSVRTSGPGPDAVRLRTAGRLLFEGNRPRGNKSGKGRGSGGP